jgi:hypothetical protein
VSRRRRLYRGSVYAIRVRHPHTWKIIRFGYIGKTRRSVEVRIAEHAERQPWRHLIVDYEVLVRLVDHSRMRLRLRLWWAEVWRIMLFRPLFNIEWNRRNPRRIKPWDARKLATTKTGAGRG